MEARWARAYFLLRLGCNVCIADALYSTWPSATKQIVLVALKGRYLVSIGLVPFGLAKICPWDEALFS